MYSMPTLKVMYSINPRAYMTYLSGISRDPHRPHSLFELSGNKLFVTTSVSLKTDRSFSVVRCPS